MYLSILISPDRTKYMSSGHCCMYFCFVTFGVYIDLKKNYFDCAMKLEIQILLFAVYLSDINSKRLNVCIGYVDKVQSILIICAFKRVKIPCFLE